MLKLCPFIDYSIDISIFLFYSETIYIYNKNTCKIIMLTFKIINCFLKLHILDSFNDGMSASKKILNLHRTVWRLGVRRTDILHLRRTVRPCQ